MLTQLKEIYAYREMLKNLINKELRARYKGSFLGFFWTFFNPLLMLVVYSVVFSLVMRIQVENYAMFLFAGLLPWNFFSVSMQMGASSIIFNSNLIKKIYFPREVLPLAMTAANLINYLFSLAILLPALLIYGIPLSGYLLLFPVIVFLQSLFVVGMVLIVSSATVYLRDLEHIITVFMVAWFYMTPVIYPLTMIPEKYRWLFWLNPLTPLITAYQDIFINGRMPDFPGMVYFTVLSVSVFLLGMTVFNHLKGKFAEQI